MKQWLTEKEAAARVKRTVQNLRFMRARKVGPPFVQWGRVICYSLTVLDDWLTPCFELEPDVKPVLDYRRALRKFTPPPPKPPKKFPKFPLIEKDKPHKADPFHWQTQHERAVQSSLSQAKNRALKQATAWEDASELDIIPVPWRRRHTSGKFMKHHNTTTLLLLEEQDFS